MQDFYNRGLIKDKTQNFTFKELKNFYIGFDPTAQSLHIGNLLLIINIIKMYHYGLQPFIILGGATAMIGDPSGKSCNRNILQKDVICHNVECIYQQLYMLFFKHNCQVTILDNYEWFKKINIISFLKDVGRYFSVNYMLSKESMKNRLKDKGVGFNEFVYQLFQAYDFLFLYKRMKCYLQIGGSDQWGNIISGIDLIKYKINKVAYGLTFPIVTNKKGEKIGKSNDNNHTIWLNEDMTSIYLYYQFWLQISDIEAKYLIKLYSFASLIEINSIIHQHDANPHMRYIQKYLSKEMTVFIYGSKEFERVYKCSMILYDINYLCMLEKINTVSLFTYFFKGVPYKIFYNTEYITSINEIHISTLLVDMTNFISSNSEVKRLLNQRSIYLNNHKIKINRFLSQEDLIYNHYILLRKGRKSVFVVFFA